MDASILLAATINGLLIGGIYTLVASGLTLIYGVLHIINFAHGSLLMLAMFGGYFLLTKLGVDPYLSLVVMVPAMFALGYVLYRGLIGKLAHGKDENILLTPPRRMGLEVALTYIQDDELVEVTPGAIRLRKRELDPNERKKAQKRAEADAL